MTNIKGCGNTAFFYKPKVTIKSPTECENMQNIRTEIDAIDHQVIQLIGQRFGYVKAASKFKTSETSLKAPERFKIMRLQRRIWA